MRNSARQSIRLSDMLLWKRESLIANKTLKPIFDSHTNVIGKGHH